MEMEAQAGHNEKVSGPATTKSSCRMNKRVDEATFLEDLKDHIDEFIHASMEEHKNCFKATMNKMFGMTKAVSSVASEEALLPIRASLWDWA